MIPLVLNAYTTNEAPSQNYIERERSMQSQAFLHASYTPFLLISSIQIPNGTEILVVRNHFFRMKKGQLQ